MNTSRLTRAFRVYARIFPLLFFGIFVPLQLARTDEDRDSIVYYQSLEKAEAGESLYQPYPPMTAHQVGLYYLYPPPFVAVLSFLPAMGWVTFARLMLLACVAGYWAFAASLSALWSGRATLDGTLVAGALLFLFLPLPDLLQLGNVDLVLLPLAGWAVASPKLRGAFFTIVAAVKTIGTWPLIAWASRRPRPALVSAAVGGGILLGLTVLALGPARTVASSLEWYEHVLPTVGQGQFHPGNAWAEMPWGGEHTVRLPPNISIPFAPVAIAAKLGWVDPDRQLPYALRMYLLICATFGPVLVAYLTRRLDPALQCALVLSAAVMLGPLARPPYLAYCFPALVLLWKWRVSRETARQAQWDVRHAAVRERIAVELE